MDKQVRKKKKKTLKRKLHPNESTIDKVTAFKAKERKGVKKPQGAFRKEIKGDQGNLTCYFKNLFC